MMNKIPEVIPSLHAKVLNRHGIVRLSKDIPCHSFVRNWYMVALQQMCLINCAAAYSTLSVVDRTGTGYNSSSSAQPFLTNTGLGSSHAAPIGDDDYGIIVGTDSTAWVYTQYDLETQVLHGEGDGLLSHSAMSTYATVSDVDYTRTASLVRSFNNNGSTQIDIEEIGWALADYIAAPDRFFLAIRDLVGTTIELSAAEALEVTLELSLAYPILL